MVRPWESLVIGAIGGFMCVITPLGIDRLKIDDPVGAVAVHGVGGLWVSVYFFIHFIHTKTEI